MRTVIEQWGDSDAIRIPANLMRAASLSVGQMVEVREEAGRLIVEPARPHSYDVAAMIDGISDDNLHAEVSTGNAVGNEVW